MAKRVLKKPVKVQDVASPYRAYHQIHTHERAISIPVGQSTGRETLAMKLSAGDWIVDATVYARSVNAEEATGIALSLEMPFGIRYDSAWTPIPPASPTAQTTANVRVDVRCAGTFSQRAEAKLVCATRHTGVRIMEVRWTAWRVSPLLVKEVL